MAACERMRPQSMAEIVHDLEAEGLVSRRPDPTDGRRVVIELTDAGLDLLHNTRETRETWLTDVLERELDSNERILLQRTRRDLNTEFLAEFTLRTPGEGCRQDRHRRQASASGPGNTQAGPAERELPHRESPHW